MAGRQRSKNALRSSPLSARGLLSVEIASVSCAIGIDKLVGSSTHRVKDGTKVSKAHSAFWRLANGPEVHDTALQEKLKDSN